MEMLTMQWPELDVDLLISHPVCLSWRLRLRPFCRCLHSEHVLSHVAVWFCRLRARCRSHPHISVQERDAISGRLRALGGQLQHLRCYRVVVGC